MTPTDPTLYDDLLTQSHRHMPADALCPIARAAMIAALEDIIHTAQRAIGDRAAYQITFRNTRPVLTVTDEQFTAWITAIARHGYRSADAQLIGDTFTYHTHNPDTGQHLTLESPYTAHSGVTA